MFFLHMGNVIKAVVDKNPFFKKHLFAQTDHFPKFWGWTSHKKKQYSFNHRQVIMSCGLDVLRKCSSTGWKINEPNTFPLPKKTMFLWRYPSHGLKGSKNNTTKKTSKLDWVSKNTLTSPSPMIFYQTGLFGCKTLTKPAAVGGK